MKGTLHLIVLAVIAVALVSSAYAQQNQASQSGYQLTCPQHNLAKDANKPGEPNKPAEPNKTALCAADNKDADKDKPCPKDPNKPVDPNAKK